MTEDEEWLSTMSASERWRCWWLLSRAPEGRNESDGSRVMIAKSTGRKGAIDTQQTRSKAVKELCWWICRIASADSAWFGSSAVRSGSALVVMVPGARARTGTCEC